MGRLNKGGRPQKFDENELIKMIEEYINNEHDKGQPIKITKLAKNLKDKGLNIVYQDLNRYNKVKSYIEEYNNQIKSKGFENTIKTLESNTVPAKKGVGGRPRKFDEEELLIAVKGYVKSLQRPELIKITRVAKYFQDKGIKITYQDLGRYKEVNEFIKDYNQKLKDVLLTGVVEIDTEKQIPMFEHIDIKEFLRNNKTTEQIEKALKILNQTNEKLVESCEKLQNKIITQNDKIITQSNEIERLNSEIELLKFESKKREEELKVKNKKLKNNLQIKARKMAMYEEFIHRYHYSGLAEYAINLECGASNENLARLGDFFDDEKYLQGNFKLKDIADKYVALNLAIDNIEHEYIKEDEYNLESSEMSNSCSNDLSNFIGKENTKNTEKIEENEVEDGTGMEKLNLTMEDIDSSLSFLDEI
ncbi:MAG: hypothetical protein ACRC3Y_14260 [Romboutsia sp.]|uniref:hypothetical protein n=1 Tax=Romboutsia sp. TaxID=1965302 RepID=UPI003F2FA601